MTMLSCETFRGAPKHCVTKSEHFLYADVVASKRAIHEYDENGVASKHTAYADRVAYLEGRCVGINAIRGE